MENEIINYVKDDQAIISPHKPPAIEVVEVSIERGFANSGTTTDWEEDFTW